MIQKPFTQKSLNPDPELPMEAMVPREIDQLYKLESTSKRV
jgi:hypothetical protein